MIIMTCAFSTRPTLLAQHGKATRLLTAACRVNRLYCCHGLKRPLYKVANFGRGRTYLKLSEHCREHNVRDVRESRQDCVMEIGLNVSPVGL